VNLFGIHLVDCCLFVSFTLMNMLYMCLDYILHARMYDVLLASFITCVPQCSEPRLSLPSLSLYLYLLFSFFFYSSGEIVELCQLSRGRRSSIVIALTTEACGNISRATLIKVTFPQ